ncbi:MAG TPA: 16S rRNA (adenine(1518)-N(6)/adenine(1519)-N(6))-dimethyltransferase RsmA [Rhizomicrobium sp.]|jgi:16S rRNA (adenine1518-N6/adenine1519-N6)-dimethyltransferase|nr:16S rRNA (adenine(1518)-N(6)/adenine(1519)-N(6))-dimethyltransferase RsmA [Rhizomicrobium sp.]
MPETAEPLSDPLPPLREVIAAYGLAAKKSLGQNFLLDLNLTRKIARAAGPLGDATIFEVGPGPGGLTRALLMEGAEHVIAVERDERCLPALEQVSAAYPGRLEVLCDDAMKIDETKRLNGPVRIAANLPYNIGSALLVKWLTSETWPPFWQSATLMFQREVAERLVAKPGGKAYGRLSILTQWRAKAKILFDVSPRAFTPPPKVTSSIVRLEPLAEPVAPARLRDLEAVTAAAFGNRRKMLRQSLKSLAPDTEAFIRAAGLDPTQRAEQLSIADFASLARQLRAR